jgi:hypothetical protein
MAPKYNRGGDAVLIEKLSHQAKSGMTGKSKHRKETNDGN